MLILTLTIDKSYFLNLVVNNEFHDLTLTILNFIINMVYLMTNYHLVSEIIKKVVEFVKVDVFDKLPIGQNNRDKIE